MIEKPLLAQRTRLTRGGLLCSGRQVGREKKGRTQEGQPLVLRRKGKMLSDLGTQPVRLALEVRTGVYLPQISTEPGRNRQPLSPCFVRMQPERAWAGEETTSKWL